jgi:hypothetical protein
LIPRKSTQRPLEFLPFQISEIAQYAARLPAKTAPQKSSRVRDTYLKKGGKQSV